MTYCEQQSNSFFSLNIWRNKIIIFWAQFIFFSERFSYICPNANFSISSFQLYIILCHSEIFLALTSQSTVTNTTNTSLSLTTLTASCILQLHFSYIVCSLSVQFHYFPISHDTMQFILMNFSDCSIIQLTHFISEIISG